MHCVACSHVWNIGTNEYNHRERCPRCNSRLTKPNIVFFNENAPMYEKLDHDFNLKRRNNDDLILYVGSSMSVIPPSRLIQKRNNKLNNILVNFDKQHEDVWFGHQYYGKATEQMKIVNEQLIEKLLK